MKSIKSFVGIVLILLIVILTFTPVVGYFPFFRRVWIFLLVGVMVLTPFNLNFYLSRGFFCLALSAVVMLLNVMTSDSYFDTEKVITEISMLIFTALISLFAFREGHKHSFMKWCIMTVFAIITIETIATFILDQQSPGILRGLFSESINSGEREELLYPFYRFGLSNYVLPHAMPVLIPPLVMGLRDKANPFWQRIWSTVFLLFVLLLIWLSGVMTAFLLAVLFLLLALFTSFSKKPSLKIFIGFCLLFLPFLFFDELTLYVVRVSQDIFSGNEYISSKLLEFEESLNAQSTTGDLAVRQDLYLASLNEFFNNIFIGTNNPMGHHSAFLDRLGTLGLVGIIPYMLFYYYQLKTVRKFIAKDRRIYFDEAVIAGLMMFSLKDIDNWELFFILFTVMPLLVYFLSFRQIEKR